MKVCKACDISLPEIKFKFRSMGGRQAGQRHSMCNSCLYLKYTRPEVERKIAVIQKIKLDSGCVDCGYREHVEALDFDHLPESGKLFNIGEKMGTFSLAKLLEEAAKCEVRCANCHRVKTARRREMVKNL
jgi:ribosomal protein L44E